MSGFAEKKGYFQQTHASRCNASDNSPAVKGVSGWVWDWNERMFRKLSAGPWSRNHFVFSLGQCWVYRVLRPGRPSRCPRLQFFPQPSLSLLFKGNNKRILWRQFTVQSSMQPYRIQTKFRDKSRVIQLVFYSLSPQSLSFPQYIYCSWVCFWQWISIK